MTITDDEIQELEAAFRREGNKTMARFCNRARIGNLMPEARARCAEIRDARLIAMGLRHAKDAR